MQGKDICEYNKCTGCFACANVCPKSCIFLKENSLGEIHPEVDQNLCIDCRKCQKTCPNNRDQKYRYPSHCYAAWIENKEKTKICASGGIGTALSECVINQGGVIFGSRYNDSMIPVISYTNKIEDLELFKGSRYVQTQVGCETFKAVKNLLNKGILVLYIGTPCQVAGLYGYLKKDCDNLITVDLICHGVSPTTYLEQEVEYLKKKYELDGISDIRFRGNDGNNYRLTLWNKARRKLFPRNNYRQKILDKDFLDDCYLQGFLRGVSLRENCYSCSYAKPERISDLTIGDFLTIGQREPFSYKHVSHVSSVTTNTEKGILLLKKLKSQNEDLMLIERGYDERLDYRPSLLEPFIRDPRNKKFREKYLEVGFPEAIRYILSDELKKELRRRTWNKFTPFAKMKRMMKKVIGKERIEAIKKCTKS